MLKNSEKPFKSYTINKNSSQLSKCDLKSKQFGDFFLEKGRLKKTEGLHWIVAAFFIVADMAGVGIFSLPRVIIGSSLYIGIGLVVIMAITATASAVVLGKAWVIMLRMFPVYRTHCRKPYSEMGYRSCGVNMRIFVSACLNLTQFGIGVTFLLITSECLSDTVKTVLGFHKCYGIVLIAVVLIPILLLKSPNDFWYIVLFAMASTMFAVVLICVGATLDFKTLRLNEALNIDESINTDKPRQLYFEILKALGVILFTFGGHSALPTVQHDMRNPSDFGKSSVLSFILIALLNIIVILVGASVYGKDILNPEMTTIMKLMQNNYIRVISEALIILHCLLVYPLMINPLNQEIEDHFNIPHEFGLKRIIVRMTLLFLMTFTALSLPSFIHVMGLLGATTLTITSLMFPPIFYLFLSAAEDKKNEEISLSNCIEKLSSTELIKKGFIHNDETNEEEPLKHMIGVKEMLQRTSFKKIFVCCFIWLIGILFGIVATYFAIFDIATMTDFTPCYVNWTGCAINGIESNHQICSIIGRENA